MNFWYTTVSAAELIANYTKIDMLTADTVADEMGRISQFTYSLRKKRLEQLCGLASKTCWHNRSRQSSASSEDKQETFRDTVDVRMESTESLLFVLTRSFAKFQLHTKLQRRASQRKFSLEPWFSLCDRRNVDSFSTKRLSHDDIERTSNNSCKEIFSDALKSGILPQSDNELAVPPIQGTNANGLVNHKKFAAFKTELNKIPQKDCLKQMLANTVEKYCAAYDPRFNYNVRFSMFFESLRRSKQALLWDHVLSTLEWSQKLDSKRS